MTEPIDPGFEVLPQPVTPRLRGRLLGSVAAVVVLAGGGAATYAAFASSSTGSGSPQSAVQKVVTDLQRADLIGVLSDLAPGERAAFTEPLRSDIASLKRLGVLSSDADPAAVSGVHFAVHKLSFADKTIKINDHVQIVRITGGTVDASAEVAKMPFTKRFLGLASSGQGSGSQHADLAKRDVRIAAEEVGGHWYASMFYTVADATAKHRVPTASDRIAAHGASTPDGAVQKTVRALMSGDVASALALISPSELGAVHDYGGMIVTAAQRQKPPSVTIKTLELTKTPISDGGVRVGLKKLVIAASGHQISVTMNRDCAQVSAGGLNQRVCAGNAADLVTNLLTPMTCSHSAVYFPSGSASLPQRGFTMNPKHGFTSCGGAPMVSAAQKRAVSDALSAITDSGVDTARVGDTWYVTPIRSIADLGSNLLSGMKGTDLFELARLGR